MKRNSLIGLLAGLAVITFLQFRIIAESALSVGGTLFLLLSDGGSEGIDWDPSLMEFRIAAAVWIGTLIVMIAMLIRRMRQKTASFSGDGVPAHTSRTAQKGFILVGVMGFVSLTCPFLVPFGPEVQGDLTTTRLLPPLSTGSATVSLRNSTPKPPGVTGLGARVADANHYLRNRHIAVSANPGRNHDGRDNTYQEIGSFPVLFLCGTDDAGRDIYSRVIYGTRVSFGIGLFATIGAVLLGLLVGVSAGLSGNIPDMLLMRFTDLVLSIPGVFIIIGFLAFVSQSPPAIILVLILTGWMHTARIVRNETLSLREREFVLAARMLRVSTPTIVMRHFLPNMSRIIFTAVVLQFANAVLGEATLGFLGLGIQPPTASWGNMMGEGTGYLGSAWWIGVFPGFLLAAVLVYAHSGAEGIEQGENAFPALPDSEGSRNHPSAQ
ncbi:MAG: ABC transporter permease [Ignavibacteria bacterium]|nr:ABC transporter permease [Ignavibacteria bacterium]